MVLNYSSEISGDSSNNSEEAMDSATLMPPVPADKVLANTFWPDLLQ